VLLNVLRARVLDFNNTVLTLLYADSDVILNLIMLARRTIFLLFVACLVSLMMGCPSKHVGPRLVKF
jgi:hypothetical protein